jgi:hypothetical protein
MKPQSTIFYLRNVYFGIEEYEINALTMLVDCEMRICPYSHGKCPAGFDRSCGRTA